MPATIEYFNKLYISKVSSDDNSNIITSKIISSRKPLICKVKDSNMSISIDAFVDNENDLNYIIGLQNYDKPLFIDIPNTRYRNMYIMIDKISISKDNLGFSNISISGQILYDYDYILHSDNKYISNSYVSETDIIPTISVLNENNVCNNANIQSFKLGKYNIYKNQEVELIKPEPSTRIKIYDTLNSNNEDDWVLISNPEKYNFIGDWVIEYNNIRLRSNNTIYIYNESTGIFENSGSYGIRTLSLTPNGLSIIYSTNINQKNCKMRLINDNIIECIFNYSRPQDNINNIFIKTYFIFDNTKIVIKLDDVISFEWYLNYNYIGNDYKIIVVNSDYQCKTAGKESDGYDIKLGSNGWGIFYDTIRDLYILRLEGSLSSSNGDTFRGKYSHTIITEYRNYTMFKECKYYTYANNGYIISDPYAINGEALSGILLDAGFIDTRINTNRIPDGDYVAIIRCKTSSQDNTIHSEDVFKFIINKVNSDGNLGDILNEIQISPNTDNFNKYAYYALPFTLTSDISGYKILIYTDTTLNPNESVITCDYVLIIPKSFIEMLQKCIYVDNNQTLVAKPK